MVAQISLLNFHLLARHWWKDDARARGDNIQKQVVLRNRARSTSHSRSSQSIYPDCSQCLAHRSYWGRDSTPLVIILIANSAWNILSGKQLNAAGRHVFGQLSRVVFRWSHTYLSGMKPSIQISDTSLRAAQCVRVSRWAYRRTLVRTQMKIARASSPRTWVRILSCSWYRESILIEMRCVRSSNM